MATIEHRRRLPVAEMAARRPRRFPGTIPMLGWVFALLAGARLVTELWPLLSPGALDAPRWREDALLVVRALGDASLIALPAALGIGFPGARRRNPWLFRGAVLLALQPLSRIALGLIQDWVTANVDPTTVLVSDPSTLVGFALGLLSLATGLIAIGGAWSLSDGLEAAWARPRRAVLLAMGAAGVAVAGVTLVPYLSSGSFDPISPGGVLSLVSIGMTLVLTALWFVIWARLAVGWATGLVPTPAWLLGALAGALLVGDRLVSVLLVLTGGLTGDGGPALVVISVAVSLPWVLLFAAFALGLGRGRPPRRRGYRLSAG